MKLSTVLAILLAPMSVLAKPPKRTAGRTVRVDRLPTCIQYCLSETKWRLKGGLPKLAGEWCRKSAPPLSPEWVKFGKALDACKKHQCDHSLHWIDMAAWDYEMCRFDDNIREESMKFFNGYRRAYWWPNERQPIRPPHSRNWISEETYDEPDEWKADNGIGKGVPEDEDPIFGEPTPKKPKPF
ncbi:hypothetical protein CSAL01_09456 [Colletotrichum salicis]|uniref:Uncharacterized protein n=1 Tax=Colletotrichum salicis TaxID=1209931 RepID=A0A135UT51_9PEZI|nr:hypothetical protein CSAL01_09456 [Colletotrichum salicis]